MIQSQGESTVYVCQKIFSLGEAKIQSLIQQRHLDSTRIYRSFCMQYDRAIRNAVGLPRRRLFCEILDVRSAFNSGKGSLLLYKTGSECLSTFLRRRAEN